MSQTRKVQGVATDIVRSNGKTKIVYHGTPVVTFDGATIELRTGGWRTATTKLRMNQASAEFGLGFSVYQQGYVWYISDHSDPASGLTVPYLEDATGTMIISRPR